MCHRCCNSRARSGTGGPSSVPSAQLHLTSITANKDGFYLDLFELKFDNGRFVSHRYSVNRSRPPTVTSGGSSSKRVQISSSTPRLLATAFDGSFRWGNLEIPMDQTRSDPGIPERRVEVQSVQVYARSTLIGTYRISSSADTWALHHYAPEFRFPTVSTGQPAAEALFPDPALPHQPA